MDISRDPDKLADALAEIVSDTSMTVADRQARLEALAAAYDLGEGDVDADPLRIQIAEALSLLSSGGHDQGR